MAEKTGKSGGSKGPVSCESAVRQIETGQIKPVYLLFGEENYLQERFIDKIKEVWLGGMAGPLNTSREDGRAMSQAQAADLACQLPFLSERKLLLIEEPGFIPCGKEPGKGKTDRDDPDNLEEPGGPEEPEGRAEQDGPGRPEYAEAPEEGQGRTGNRETERGAARGAVRGAAEKKTARQALREEQPVLTYLANPSPATCLILRCRRGKPDRRNKLVAEIAGAGGLTEAAPPAPGEIVPYLRRALEAAGKQCPPALLEQISRQSGGLGFCLQELDKVIAYAGAEQRITADMLKEVLTPSLEANIFRLVDALGQRRRAKALQELRILLDSGESPYGIFAMMLRQYRLIFRAKACLGAGMGKTQTAQVLGAHPFVAEKAAAQSRLYSFEELERAMELFLNKDLAMKSGAPPARALEDLVIAL